MTHSVLDSRQSWARLWVTLVIATVGNVGMWAIIAVMPNVETDFAASRAVVSLPYTFTMLGFALGSVIAGRIVDRHGVTRTLIAAAACNAVGFIGAGMAGSIWIMIGFQTLLGIGTAACFGPLMADISHWFLRHRGIAVAIAACGNYLSGAIWPFVLSGLLADQGWRVVYYVLAAGVLASMIPLALMLRAQLPKSAHQAADTIATQNRQKTLFSASVLTWLLAIAGIGCCMAMAMPQVHIVALSVHLGCGSQAGVEMLSLMLLGGCVSRLVSGALADRIGAVRVLLIGSCLQCLALALYLPATTANELYLVSAIFGLAQGGIVPSYTLIVREYLPARDAGLRSGIVIMATIIGMAFGGWLSGWIFDQTGNYTIAFLNGIAWNLLNIAIMMSILFKTRSARLAGV